MSSATFPDPDPDAPDPDAPGSDRAWWSDEDEDSTAYIGELTAAVAAGEELTADDISGAGFAQGGTADQMYPGHALAALVHAATTDGKVLATVSDDDLIGVLRGARRLESLAAWAQLTTLREFATRRSDPPPPAPSAVTRVPLSEFAADEVAPDLSMTWQGAAGQIAYACTVAERLPRTFAALAAGKIHPVHLRIIADETAFLAEEHLAEADEKLALAAAGKTFGKLRYYAHLLVLKLDPESALRRKDAARQDAHVRRFREGSGNAGMVARELPPDEVLASWQHIDQRARDLRAAGAPGTLQELRALAYLDLLQERDTRTTLTGRPASAHPQAPEQPAEPGTPQDGPSGDTGPGESDPGESDPGESDPGGDGSSGPGPGNGPAGIGSGRPTRDSGPGLAALVTITVPLATLNDGSATPGEAGGFGLLDPESARDVVAAAARHPDTRWCFTVLHPDGTAAAHACAPGPHLRPPDPRILKFTAVIRGPCDHAQAQARYRPGRTLRHLVTARNATCTAPGCGQPAARCDLDHTTPWHHVGLTCPCNLSPLCRHHHRMKQAQGWWLDQPAPGVLRWRTPSGRTHTTTPTQYPLD